VTPFLKTNDLARTIGFVVTLPGFVVDSQWPIEWGPEVYGYGRREFAIKDCNGYTLTFSAPAAKV